MDAVKGERVGDATSVGLILSVGSRVAVGVEGEPCTCFALGASGPYMASVGLASVGAASGAQPTAIRAIAASATVNDKR